MTFKARFEAPVWFPEQTAQGWAVFEAASLDDARNYCERRALVQLRSTEPQPVRYWLGQADAVLAFYWAVLGDGAALAA